MAGFGNFLSTDGFKSFFLFLLPAKLGSPSAPRRFPHLARLHLGKNNEAIRDILRDASPQSGATQNVKQAGKPLLSASLFQRHIRDAVE